MIGQSTSVLILHRGRQLLHGSLSELRRVAAAGGTPVDYSAIASANGPAVAMVAVAARRPLPTFDLAMLAATGSSP